VEWVAGPSNAGRRLAVPQEGDHDPDVHAGRVDGRLWRAGLAADPVLTPEAPVALTAVDLVVAAPAIGMPRMVRLVRRFISGRIRAQSGIQVWPPPRRVVRRAANRILRPWS
jgi:hypothetical protein